MGNGGLISNYFRTILNNKKFRGVKQIIVLNYVPYSRIRKNFTTHSDPKFMKGIKTISKIKKLIQFGSRY